jgi:hypothetical protein
MSATLPIWPEERNRYRSRIGKIRNCATTKTNKIERSKYVPPILTGGMTLRMGLKTGSVRAKRILFIVSKAELELMVNQLKSARAIRSRR